MTARVCNKVGCPNIIDGKGYCEIHARPAWVKTTPRKTPPGWARIRLHILHRDNNTCQYCGQPATEVDHIIPLSRGGSSRPDNLKASCKACNANKNYTQRRDPQQ